MNCVNKCLSPECFKQIYELDELEDGEIDYVRERSFHKCIEKEFRKVKFILKSL